MNINYKNKSLVTLLLSLFLATTICSSQKKETNDLLEKSENWVNELNLGDKEKEARLINVITTHRMAVQDWHNSHSFEVVPKGINPKTGEQLSDLDRSIIVDSAMPKSVHNALIDGLKADLNETQIEFILDKYTIGKVAFTLKGYHAIVTDLTAEEEAVILKNLKEAREMAIDFKQMTQISAIFEIYKTKNEQYLNLNGRNWRQLYKDYGKRIKAEKANKTN
ncbi:DUF3826 domain-containing protein [Mariniflexile jejuense]|uniref:DUF3826 domain-containing protein n=1 Tax=Mariniflexile jejuense TaxID=1173582 RepID=A0ABW3JJE4_9FLAO